MIRRYIIQCLLREDGKRRCGLCLIGFCAVFLTLLGGCAVSGTKTLTKHEKAFDCVVEAAIEKKQIPGAVLLVGVGETILLHKAYGIKEIYSEDESEPLARDTLFDLASVTKVTATATMCALLVEDGKIALDDKVSKYLDGWPYEEITIRHLATHTSGLVAYLNPKSKRVAERFPGVPSHDAVLKAIAAEPLAYKTGTRAIYSCLNFEVLARVLEEAAGEDMESLLRRRVWSKLGMKDTTFRISPAMRDRCAPTVGDLCGRVHDPLARFYGTGEHLPGNAGLFSTAADLARLLQMLVQEGQWEGRRILKPETVKLLFSNQAPPESHYQRGIGWIIAKDDAYLPVPGRYTVRLHSGFTGTYLWLDLESRCYCVLLASRLYPDGKGEAGPVRKAVIQVICRKLIPGLLVQE